MSASEEDESGDEELEEETPVDDQSLTPVEKAEKPKKAPREKTFKIKIERKKRVYRRRERRQEILDDLDLDEEINILCRTGLKNQLHTLKLSRLMVRAELMDARVRLLALLKESDLPCRRLFLDYHGLRLLHGWMDVCRHADLMHELKFKKTILEVLEVLPIGNKTILKESKVLAVLLKWIDEFNPDMKKEKVTPKLEQVEQTAVETVTNDSSSGSGDATPAFDPGVMSNIDFEKLKEIISSCDQNEKKEAEEEAKQEEMQTDEIKEEPKIPEEIAEEKAPEELPQVDNQLEFKTLREEIFVLATKLLKLWETLKEVFRIPKKERIEQMKEHEREANLTLAANEEEDKSRYSSRYRVSERPEKRGTESTNPYFKDNRPLGNRDRMLSKMKRRHLFEMQVAKEEASKREQEVWFCHEQNCMKFGLNPLTTALNDVPAMMEPISGQYYSFDRRPLPTPPCHVSNFSLKACFKRPFDILKACLKRLSNPNLAIHENKSAATANESRLLRTSAT